MSEVHWKMCFTQSPDAHWTVLDEEAVLLNLENGIYYTLNRVGTTIWESFTAKQPLKDILATLCERFDVAEDVAREDLLAFVTNLRQEELIIEAMG